MTRMLATDLDGTFIPLSQCEQNQKDLHTLADKLSAQCVGLMFVTGRHFESVKDAMQEHQLPEPDWIICDVGTTIMSPVSQHGNSAGFEPLQAYQDHLVDMVAGMTRDVVIEKLNEVKFHDSMKLQEEPKQGPFKVSFYIDAQQLDSVVAPLEQFLLTNAMPWSIIASVDPFNGDGLIDLLPTDVSKAYAIEWWRQFLGIDRDDIVFSGDSGNDLAAFCAGYKTIVVGNTDRRIARAVQQRHQRQGWQDRLFLAKRTATSGVLDGCHWFELVERDQTEQELVAAELKGCLGATPVTVSKTHFRVWAPLKKKVDVDIVQQHGTPQEKIVRFPLIREPGGYFARIVRDSGPGTTYSFRLDFQQSRPDPMSRLQATSVHGPSVVVDQDAFAWNDSHWQGIPKDQLIIYELHIGTFTQQATFESAVQRLPELLDLGVTAVELLPVYQTPGRWNWGYDGAQLFSVRNSYGGPHGLKTFVDACHQHGLAVIMDVVYNHVGPEGNYIPEFAPYFSKKHHTPWGPGLNYDGPVNEPVRQYIVDNALSWIRDYHCDGLRLDAIHYMFDDSDPPITIEIAEAVKTLEAKSKLPLHLIGETNLYDRYLLGGPDPDGKRNVPASRYDAIWADDLMHSLYSIVTDAKMTNRKYHGASDVAESLAHGYLYEGRPHFERADRNNSVQLPDNRDYFGSLVVGIQTHDMIGNHPHGGRLGQIASPAVQRAAVAMTLLYPAIPILFMGEEFNAETPFHFFVDFGDPHLQRVIADARAAEHPQHIWKSTVSPIKDEAFEKSILPGSLQGDGGMLSWYRSLIRLRKEWQASGLLRPENLQMQFDEGASLLLLTYKNSTESSFIASRICHPDAADSDVSVQIDGKILLDSAETRFSGNTGTADAGYLKNNHAVIGTGNCRIGN